MTVLPNNIVKVAFYHFKDKVQISSIVGLDDPFQFYYIFVVKLVKNAHLSVGPLGVNIILKCIEYLL